MRSGALVGPTAHIQDSTSPIPPSASPLPSMWICAQLGAREHYAIPRALHRAGRLGGLITDAWVPPGSPWRLPPGKLGERWHPGLAGADIRAFTGGRLAFDLLARARRLGTWETFMGRNAWFQRRVCRALETPGAPGKRAAATFFSYSYTARLPFRRAKAMGYRRILGQIDPGPIEHEVVEREVRAAGWPNYAEKRPPASYWDAWREEVALADVIIVNSAWSADLLVRAGVPEGKIREIPLVYEPEPDTPCDGPPVPAQFSDERPLEALFLGQIIPRKGVHLVFAAADRLRELPIRFTLAGPLGVEVPSSLAGSRRVRWLGPVGREDAARLYREADVFLLPTLSDGFAITQLEAMAHRLPVIASRRCGGVVRDGWNGLLLGGPTADELADALVDLCREPARLARLGANCARYEPKGIDFLAEQLGAL